MAYVLSLMPQSPLGTPYTEKGYESSWSSLGSNGTIHHHRPRQLSVGSLASAGSIYPTPWRFADRGTPPLRSTSYSDFETRSTSSSTAIRSRNTSTSNPVRALSVPPTVPQIVHPSSSADDHANSSIQRDCPLLTSQISALDLVDEEKGDWDDDHALLETTFDTSLHDDGLPSQPEVPGPHQPFERWMNTLKQKKALYKRRTRSKLTASTFVPKSSSTTTLTDQATSGHRKSESWASSIDFVTAVKSATITLASASIAPLSRSRSKRSALPRLFRGDSGRIEKVPRFSTDSARPSFTSVIDDAACQRARKRREKVEELIKTEESYLSDLKALSNAYFTLLPPLTPHTATTRNSARNNICNMLQLHNEVLEELHRVVPFSDHDQAISGNPTPRRKAFHVRWHSEDSIPVRRAPLEPSHSGWSTRRSWDINRAPVLEPLPLSCTPATAADVGRVFAKNMKRFALYEEYGARCELMQDDIDFTQKTSLFALDYDKAIETLSASLNPMKSREANRKKALSIKDLLIKPIQRITRYELLFKDLCRLTPSCDDPISHSVLDDVLYRLSETCRNVDEAKDNPEKLRLLENSWLLQDRLVFPDKTPRTVMFQKLGRLSLCGALYVVYRTKTSIQGCYMVCVLYESCLVLALADRRSKYKVMVGTSLASTSIEESDNGKGLQCHTAPHSWKVVFESDGKMYELIMVACSAVESSVWRDRLSGRIAVESHHVNEGHSTSFEMQSPLIRDLRSIGKAYGKARGFIRRLSVHRSATLGPMTDLNQVIIKHTAAPKDDTINSSTSSLPVGRSLSVPSSSHVPTLAPMRTERIKLEIALSEVWTKDYIPYPGMGARRTENMFRDTANDLIRKLSMASLASNFSRRSMSYASTHNTHSSTDKHMRTKAMARPEVPKIKRPPLVNFHNAPDAFLPEDFELQNPSSKRSRMLGLRTLTMTDRPRSPFFFSENKVPEVKRAKSSAGARATPSGERKLLQKQPSVRKATPLPVQHDGVEKVVESKGKEAKMVGADTGRKKRPSLFRYLSSKTRGGGDD